MKRTEARRDPDNNNDPFSYELDEAGISGGQGRSAQSISFDSTTLVVAVALGVFFLIIVLTAKVV